MTTIGLCARCSHAATVTSARGSTFFRCALHDTDAAYAKYPRLPVLECGGFEERA